MMKTSPAIIISIGILFIPDISFANMPVLTPKPSAISLKSCQQWAMEQDEDAKEMWGVRENGEYSNEIGTARLVLECLGEKAPEIVGFGSSAGFADSYCKKHGKTKICHDAVQNGMPQ